MQLSYLVLTYRYCCLSTTGTSLVSRRTNYKYNHATSSSTQVYDVPYNVENNYENRQAYRTLLFTTPGLNQYISGVIQYEETLEIVNLTPICMSAMVRMKMKSRTPPHTWRVRTLRECASLMMYILIEYKK